MGLFSKKPNVEELAAKKDVKGLVEALKHKEPRVREQAAKALGQIGHASSVAPLLRARKDKEQIVQLAAKVALAKITEEEKDIKSLIEALKHEEPSVREQAVRTLGEIGHPSALAPLLLVMNDKDPLVRVAAAEALAKTTGTVGAEVERLKETMKDRPLQQ